MAGFYRSKYKPAVTPSPGAAKEGEDYYMFSTQFEPCDARRAFPCFDEPNLKATFEFEVEIPEDQIALSNMPEKETRKGGKKGLKVVSFEKTPAMSTYVSCLLFENGTNAHIVSSSLHGLLETSSMLKDTLSGNIMGRTYQSGYILPKDSRSKVDSHWSMLAKPSTSFPRPSKSIILFRNQTYSLFMNFRWVPWRTGVLSHTEQSLCYLMKPSRIQGTRIEWHML